MMKRRNIYIILVILGVLFTAGVLLITNLDSPSLTKNYGISNMTINIYGGAANSPDIDSVVPSMDELILNLTKKNYSITQNDVVDNLGISANRIYAKKGSSFIDICYGLADSDLEEVFKHFENIYEKYYILALNGDYVYCVSDKKTFRNAGFDSLANVGIQYIWE